MKRVDTWITQSQFNFLTSLPGTLAEHIRRALDDYIQKLTLLNVSASQSKKGGADE